jgi:hypothetical protein
LEATTSKAADLPWMSKEPEPGPLPGECGLLAQSAYLVGNGKDCLWSPTKVFHSHMARLLPRCNMYRCHLSPVRVLVKQLVYISDYIKQSQKKKIFFFFAIFFSLKNELSLKLAEMSL